MSRYLLDANILLRRLDESDPRHETAKAAIGTLEAQGIELCVTSQNIIEFWADASRPEMPKSNMFDHLDHQPTPYIVEACNDN